jgi:capsular polysaccharide biosynthesis protein
VPSEGEIFLPTARKMAAHERKLIECLLPKNLVLVSVSRFVLFSADTFIFLPFLSSIRSGRLPADYLSYFRRKVYSAYGIKASRPQLRLFISRRSNPKRQFENQDEVERFFVNQGFLCLQLEQIPIGRQIECFANANVVVGSHGAGLTNIIFSPVTCKVVEIFHSADSKHLCHYRDLADAVGLSYFSVFLDAEDKDARAHLPVEIVRDILHNLNEPKG